MRNGGRRELQEISRHPADDYRRVIYAPHVGPDQQFFIKERDLQARNFASVEVQMQGG
jgi:hypothetical protein